MWAIPSLKNSWRCTVDFIKDPNNTDGKKQMSCCPCLYRCVYQPAVYLRTTAREMANITLSISVLRNHESCFRTFLGSAGPSCPPTPKDIPAQSHGRVFCSDNFHSVYVVKGVLNLRIDRLFNRCLSANHQITRFDWNGKVGFSIATSRLHPYS
mgnify:CR=1 FL=1